MNEEIEERDKEFEELKKENDEIREELNELIGINSPTYFPIWVKIGELIDNEIEQEDLCGK